MTASPEQLAEELEQHRPHLRAVAYRLLGSTTEAEDAVQESWIRLGRTDGADVANLRGWLTTVVARVCLDMLRARSSRKEGSPDVRLPDPIVTSAEPGAAHDVVLADSRSASRCSWCSTRSSRRSAAGAARRP